MTETMAVEFIGGPWDGDVREIDATMRYIRVPLHKPVEVWRQDDSPECIRAMLDSLRVGVYSPKGNPREFVWRGEP